MTKLLNINAQAILLQWTNKLKLQHQNTVLNYASYFNDLATAIKFNTITTTTTPPPPPHTNSKLKTLSSLQMNDNTIQKGKEHSLLYLEKSSGTEKSF